MTMISTKMNERAAAKSALTPHIEKFRQDKAEMSAVKTRRLRSRVESNMGNEENELLVSQPPSQPASQPSKQSIYAELAESDLESTQAQGIAHFIHAEWDNLTPVEHGHYSVRASPAPP